MKVKLEDVAEKIFAGGDVPKNRFSDIRTEEYCVPIYANAEKDDGLYGYTNEARVYDESVTVAARGTIGFCAIRREPFLPVVRLITVIPKKEEISLEYLYYALRNCKPKSSGTSIPQLTVPDIKKYTFNLVALEEQERIATLLHSVEEIICKRKEQLAGLNELVKARFVELFGNPDANSKGWDECPLSEKLNVLGGYAFKSDKFDENDGIPVLRIANINAGYFKPVNMVYWQEDKCLERYAMYPGDLVMSLTGTVGKDDYGNVCILGDDYEMYYLNQRNAKLEIKEGIDKYYLSQLLKFEQIKKRLTGISRGVRQANISNKDILNLVVPVPPMDLQEQFSDFVHQVNKSKFEVQKSLDEIQTLMDSLMQKYLG